MIMIFAPLAINSLNASGKARSQQMRMPTGPRGVWNVSCAACVEEVRWGRSGCLHAARVWSAHKFSWGRRIKKLCARGNLNESTIIPEVLLLIPGQYLPLIINEVSNIMQLVLPRLSILMHFHNRPRHNAYLELFRQLLISVQVIVPLRTEGEEFGVFGHPIREMVFGQDGEVGAFRSGGS